MGKAHCILYCNIVNIVLRSIAINISIISACCYCAAVCVIRRFVDVASMNNNARRNIGILLCQLYYDVKTVSKISFEHVSLQKTECSAVTTVSNVWNLDVEMGSVFFLSPYESDFFIRFITVVHNASSIITLPMSFRDNFNSTYINSPFYSRLNS